MWCCKDKSLSLPEVQSRSFRPYLVTLLSEPSRLCMCDTSNGTERIAHACSCEFTWNISTLLGCEGVGSDHKPRATQFIGYLMSFISCRLFTIECNWRGGRKSEKKVPVRISSVSAEIRTGYLPNTNQSRCRLWLSPRSRWNFRW
jgi:hypothetical protein